MIKEAISKAMNKENLTREEALQVMKEIMSGEAEQSQVAAFLVALHMKGRQPRRFLPVPKVCEASQRSSTVAIWM